MHRLANVFITLPSHTLFGFFQVSLSSLTSLHTLYLPFQYYNLRCAQIACLLYLIDHTRWSDIWKLELYLIIHTMRTLEAPTYNT